MCLITKFELLLKTLNNVILQIKNSNNFKKNEQHLLFFNLKI